MKRFYSIREGILIFVLSLTCIIFLAQSGFPLAKTSGTEINIANSIFGQVFDQYNRPVNDLDVELMNDNSYTVGRTRTKGGGRFSFTGFSAGNYKVTVYTLGTDYLQQTQEVQIVSLILNSSDQQFIDFYLKLDPRKVNLNNDLTAPDTIFVQDGIPGEARDLFKTGIKRLANKSKNDKGLDELAAAIRIAPDYYDALIHLGVEYVQRNEYQKALPFLVKAIDINRTSYSAFYNLGYACYQLNQIPEAVEAFRGAIIIKPASANAQLFYGTVLRISGDFVKSEKALLQVKESGETSIPQVHYQLALLYNRTGRNKEAVEQLETYLKALPDNPDKQNIQNLILKLKNSGK